jgi:hypothetical protein
MDAPSGLQAGLLLLTPSWVNRRRANAPAASRAAASASTRSPHAARAPRHYQRTRGERQRDW